jgi:hypothetical protein
MTETTTDKTTRRSWTMTKFGKPALEQARDAVDLGHDHVCRVVRLGQPRCWFSELAGEHIDIEMISTFSIEISCVIAGEGVEQALQALHSAFELSGSGTVGEEEPFEASRRL